MSIVVEEQPMDSAVDLRNRAWALTIGVGSPVWVKDRYNETERFPNRIPRPTAVLEIRKQRSQTGVVFHVKTIGGGSVWLDAGWFVVGARPWVEEYGTR